MATFLRWIIVLAMGWEPSEDQKGAYIHDVLNANNPTANTDGFTYIPVGYVAEINNEIMNEISETQSILATFDKVEYLLEEDQVGEYIYSKMPVIFEFGEYEASTQRYIIPEQGIEGFIVLLYGASQEETPSASSTQNRKMVQQIKGGKRKGLPKIKKSLSPIRRKPFGSPTESMPNMKTQVKPLTPPGQGMQATVSLNNFEGSNFQSPRMESQPSEPQNHIDNIFEGAVAETAGEFGEQGEGNEWESFLDELDTEVTDGIEETQASQSPTANYSNTAFTQTRPTGPKVETFDRAKKIDSHRNKAHIPQMYMNFQETEEPENEFSEWDDFLGGLDEEVGLDEQKIEEEKKENESKIFQGRGLILTKDEIALEKAIKKHESSEKTKTPARGVTPLSKLKPPTPSPAYTPPLPTTQSRNDYMPPMTPTVAKPYPTAPGSQMSQSGLYQNEIQQSGLHQNEMQQSGLHQRNMQQSGLHQRNMQQSGLHQRDPQQSGLHQRDPQQPVTPTPAWQQGSSSGTYHKPAQIYSPSAAPMIDKDLYATDPRIKQRRKKASTFKKFVLFLFLFIIFGVGGLFGWYVMGGDVHLNPYLGPLKPTLIMLKQKVMGTSPEGSLEAELKALLKIKQMDYRLIIKLDTFMKKASAPKHKKLFTLAKKRKEGIIKNVKGSLESDFETFLSQSHFLKCEKLLQNHKKIEELSPYLKKFSEKLEQKAQKTYKKEVINTKSLSKKGKFDRALERLEKIEKKQIQTIKTLIKKEKQLILKYFVENCNKRKIHVKGVKYLFRFSKTKPKEKHTLLQTNMYILWLIHHHMLLFTSENEYRKAYRAIARYKKIKKAEFESILEKFLTEIKSENAFWKQLIHGVNKLKESKNFINIKYTRKNKTRALKGRIVGFDSGYLEILSARRIRIKLGSLSWKTLKFILKRGRIKIISEEENLLRGGLYLFSQGRYQDAKEVFKSIGKSGYFDSKIQYTK